MTKWFHLGVTSSNRVQSSYMRKTLRINEDGVLALTLKFDERINSIEYMNPEDVIMLDFRNPTLDNRVIHNYKKDSDKEFYQISYKKWFIVYYPHQMKFHFIFRGSKHTTTTSAHLYELYELSVLGIFNRSLFSVYYPSNDLKQALINGRPLGKIIQYRYENLLNNTYFEKKLFRMLCDKLKEVTPSVLRKIPQMVTTFNHERKFCNRLLKKLKQDIYGNVKEQALFLSEKSFYLLDFYFIDFRTGVESDGLHHVYNKRQVEYDYERDFVLFNAYNISNIRITNPKLSNQSIDEILCELIIRAICLSKKISRDKFLGLKKSDINYSWLSDWSISFQAYSSKYYGKGLKGSTTKGLYEDFENNRVIIK